MGKLIYLSHTRLDIAYAVSVVSQFMHNPKEIHIEAVFKILHYLKSTPSKGIQCQKAGGTRLEAYTDVDWVGSIIDQRSTSSYCTFLGGNLVTWRSKKQLVVAKSSVEAKFRSMAHGIYELWMKIILTDFRVRWEGSMRLYRDNKSTISISHNPIQHDRTKHIEVDQHFIKEKLDSRLVCIPYISTKNQLADILINGLTTRLFCNITSKSRMKNIYSPT